MIKISVLRSRSDSQRLSIIREYIHEESKGFFDGYLVSYIHLRSLSSVTVLTTLVSLVMMTALTTPVMVVIVPLLAS
jgi:hypothetical protein